MKRILPAILLALTCVFAQSQAAPTAPKQTNEVAQSDEALIRAAMAAQTDAWNRGDIKAFMTPYDNSEKTTFIGATLRKGFEPIRQRYMKSYSSPEQMGKLTFSELDIRLFGSECGSATMAVVTGKFHLDRATKGEAKKDDGIFSLVWLKGPAGWKIVLDHTS